MLQSSQFNEFSSGIRAELPILVGVAPFGMIYGVLAVASGLDLLPAQLMSSIVFAGSSQFILTQMIAAGTPALLMVFSVTIINLRHMLYSASMAPYLQHLPSRWKITLAYLLTDEAYAITIIHYRDKSDEQTIKNRHWFLLGAGLALWSCWQISTFVGIFLGALIPSSWSLDFTLALTFIALLIPMLKNQAYLLTALVSGIVALAAYSLPYRLGLVIAAVFGIVTGLWLERRK